MAKTQPIGVRFDKNLLEDLFNSGIALSAQKALNLYEKSYEELIRLRVQINNQSENKERILKEGELISVKNFNQPDPPTNYTINTKKSFNELLSKAKAGTLNEKELDAANLPFNQRDLILRKIKQ